MECSQAAGTPREPLALTTKQSHHISQGPGDEGGIKLAMTKKGSDMFQLP
jgi:hypothetical protein